MKKHFIFQNKTQGRGIITDFRDTGKGLGVPIPPT